MAVVGITNRPDTLDDSMLRTGRLDLMLYVGPPDEDDRLKILRILTKQMPLSEDVNLQERAVATQNYTGADLAMLCREAAVQAMRRGSSRITDVDFVEAFEHAKPSVTPEMRQWYSSIGENMSSVMPKKIDKVFYG